MKVGVLGTPRPMPSRLLPALAGALVVAFALPVFLVAGWPIAGWGLAALIWAATQAFQLVLTRLRPAAGNLAASSVMGFGMMFRLVGVMVVLVAVVASNRGLGLAALVTYGLAYTVELGTSLLAYFGRETA